MTELYKVLFAYDTDKEDELALKQGETIRITSKDSPDWWFAERLDTKESGLVPSNFIEKYSSEDIVLAIVTQDYLAQSPEEISLQKNRIVTVLDQHVSEGWWKGDLNGKTGIFPADHVEFVEEGEHPSNDDNKSKKDAFKLAAYGVKQGGIGSILAGGFSLRRSSTTGNRSSVNEKSSSRPNSSNTPTETNAPSIPSKPHPTLIQKDTPSDINNDNNNTGIAKSSSSTSRAMVIHDYKPENNDEIQLMRGEYVTVVDQLENDGWWKGTSESGATGIFPSNFVQIIEQERPPQRPTRTRPATVKTESTENMAKPPPVPVTTRPTSLLSNRDSSSVTSPPPPPRPITTPPRPTTTSPPVPTRRTNSIILPTSAEIGHRRIPSIPLTAPDLPPMSPVHERHSRSIPRPTSHDSASSSSSATSPLSPRNNSNSNNNSNSSSSTRPPELSANTLQHMAKPPKVNFGVNKGPPPVRSPSTSRPCSINDAVPTTGEVHPAVPRRSMPPVPETSNTVPSIAPTSPARLSTDHMKPIKPPQPTTRLPSTPVVAAPTAKTDDDYHHDHDKDDNDRMIKLDPLMEAKLRQLVKIETEKIRKEFEIRLEDERIERLRFQVEFEELKARLSSS